MKNVLKTIYDEILTSSVDTYPFARRIKEAIEKYVHGLEIGSYYVNGVIGKSYEISKNCFFVHEWIIDTEYANHQKALKLLGLK